MIVRSFLLWLLSSAIALAAVELRSGVTAVWVRPGWEVFAPATFFNAGSQPVRVVVEMDTTGMPAGSYPYFCWGPSCYAPGVLFSPDTVTLAPGAEERSFKAYVYVDRGTPARTSSLRFLLREASTGAVLLQHAVVVHIGIPSEAPLQLVWAQTGIAATAGTSGEATAAVYNGGTTTQRLLVRLEPLGTPAEAVELCLGDTCYGAGTLVAADTLSLAPGQLFARLRCRARIGDTAEELRVLLSAAESGTLVAEYAVTFSRSTDIAHVTEGALCTRPLVVQERLLIPAEPGTTLELYTLLGQLRLHLSGEAIPGFHFRGLEPGVYSYRLLRGKRLVCSGMLLYVN